MSATSHAPVAARQTVPTALNLHWKQHSPGSSHSSLPSRMPLPHIGVVVAAGGCVVTALVVVTRVVAALVVTRVVAGLVVAARVVAARVVAAFVVATLVVAPALVVAAGVVATLVVAAAFVVATGVVGLTVVAGAYATEHSAKTVCVVCVADDTYRCFGYGQSRAKVVAVVDGHAVRPV